MTEIAKTLPRLQQGMIVNYVLPDGRSQGQIRPALIVRVWNQLPPGCLNLIVFIDGSNDYPLKDPAIEGNTIWATSIIHSDKKEPGTWHWQEILDLPILANPQLQEYAQVEAKAQIAFQAYSKSANGLNYQDNTITEWEVLPMPVQKHWLAVVLAILNSEQSTEQL